jgi:hypothetical protein
VRGNIITNERFAYHEILLLLEFQGDFRLLEIDIWRNSSIFEYQDALQEAGKTTAGLQVTNVRFDRSDIQV